MNDLEVVNGGAQAGVTFKIQSIPANSTNSVHTLLCNTSSLSGRDGRLEKNSALRLGPEFIYVESLVVRVHERNSSLNKNLVVMHECIRGENVHSAVIDCA